MGCEMKQNLFNTLLIALAVSVIGIVIYVALTLPDQRTTSEKMGDAVDTLGDSISDAARELEPRTPAEKFGDAVKDIGSDMKSETAP